jgi:micrococcal nuclease
MTKHYYRAHVTSVYDGDTITVDIDLGFGIVMHKQKIRLFGINTPEVRGAEKVEGKKVRDFVREIILAKDIEIQTIKSEKKGKYGRWLGTIYFNPNAGDENIILDASLQRGITGVDLTEWVCLNSLLVDLGMAEEVNY